jgi:hypothetical protein
VAGYPQALWNMMSLFSCPHSSSVSNNTSSQDGAWQDHAELWEVTKYFSSPMLTCYHTGVIKSLHWV